MQNRKVRIMTWTWPSRLSTHLLLGGSLIFGSLASAQPLRPLGLLRGPDTSVPRARLLASATASLPPQVDLSAELPPPGNQGNLGSCVGFAVGYAYKSFQERRDQGWQYDTTAHVFSPAYIFNQIHTGTDPSGGGSFFEDAFRLLQNQGCATLSVMPYDGSDYGYTTQPTALMTESAAQYKSASWAALPAGDFNEVRARLSNREVVIIGIPVYPDFDSLSVSNPIYDDVSGSSRGDHALVVVGYDDSKQALKFINSWGVNYGLVGYGWISYELFSRIAWGSYVMTDLPASPVTFVDTTSTSLNLGNTLPTLIKKDFTVEMWVNPSSSQETYADIIDFNHRTNVGMVIQQNANTLNQFVFGIGNGTTSSGITYQLQTNVWQHLAFQRTGSTLQLYVNGTLVATAPCFADDIYYLANSSVTVAYNANYGRHFSGTIKGLKIWDYARSPASIQAHALALSTFTFNGSTDGINLGGQLIPRMVNSFSMEMWLNPGSAQQTYADVIDFNHRANVGIVVQQNGNATNRFSFSVGNGSASSVVEYQFQSNVWQRVRFERLEGVLRLFVNDSLVATAPCFTGPVSFLANSEVTVGFNKNYGRHFNGSIYDLKLNL